jgi:hypothetical protein
MKKSTLIGGTGVFVAAMGSALFGFSSVATASSLYEATNVNVKVTGDDATALNKCINDAKDGAIQSQQNACLQSASASNLVTLEDATVFVLSSGFPSALLFNKTHVNVEVSGGAVNAINACVNDAQDGFIQSQQNACAQTAVAGNVLSLTKVNVKVL